MRRKIVIITTNIIVIYSLTCEEILKLPAEKKLSLTELHTVPPEDLVDCLTYFGKEQLANPEAFYIWESIITFYDGVANVPENVLSRLHWVTTAVTPEDYANMSLGDIDVIENFGVNYNLSGAQLAAMANRVREDFGNKEPEDYTYYDLIALKQILCQFNTSLIERIHPSAYREAALTIGKLEKCSSDTMRGFATLAMHPDAFGPPQTWTNITIKTMGKVAKYLPRAVIEKYNLSP